MVLSRIWLRSRRNASIAVSIRWIASPNLQVTILTTMRAIDFSSEDIDCSIRHGAGSWPELDNSDLTAPAAERILHAAHSIEQLTSRELITSLERSMRIPCLIALAGVLGLTAQGQAQVARQEVHPVQSVTLSDTEFLSGKQDGKPVTLAGVLRLPKVGPERLPAVVLLHGAGGMGGSGSSIDEWSQELNQIGIATAYCTARRMITIRSLRAVPTLDVSRRSGRTFVWSSILMPITFSMPQRRRSHERSRPHRQQYTAYWPRATAVSS